jgi:hypothetical protein
MKPLTKGFLFLTKIGLHVRETRSHERFNLVVRGQLLGAWAKTYMYMYKCT